MAKVESLEALLEAELRDLYDAEKQLVRALPKPAKKARDPELRRALQEHRQQTEMHVERLEQVFDLLNKALRGKKCRSMQHLIAEGEEVIGSAKDEETRDAAIVASAQKAEHYEIAGYGAARTWAARLGRRDAADLLQQTLDEEKEADARLTDIAEGAVNAAAAGEAGEAGSARSTGGSKRRAIAADRGTVPVRRAAKATPRRRA